MSPGFAMSDFWAWARPEGSRFLRTTTAERLLVLGAVPMQALGSHGRKGFARPPFASLLTGSKDLDIVKRFPPLAGFFLFVLAALVALQVYELRSYAGAVQQDTARWIARELSFLVAKPDLEKLLLGDPAANEAARAAIVAAAGASEKITSISVVNREGRVVASDRLPIGRRLERPGRLFAGDPGRPFALSTDALRGSRYVTAVPITKQGEILGYLRVALDSRKIAALNRLSLMRLLVVASSGLSLVVLASWVLQRRLRRRVRDLTRVLEAAGRGEPAALPAPRKDEFAPLVEAALRVRRALHDERASVSSSRHRFEILAEALDRGLLLFQTDATVEFANDRALALLGCQDMDEVRRWLEEIRPRLGPAFARLALGQTEPESLELEMATGRSQSLRFDVYGLGEVEREGFLALVADPHEMQALETDRRLAAHLRGLSRVYLASAHDIRAPLNAMMLNLELLRGTLDDGSDPQVRTRQQRYVASITSEIQRLDRMLEALLSQTRLSGDTIERFDLREMIHDLHAFFDPYCRQKRIKLQLALPEAPVLIEGSRDAIRHGMLNLVINALEAVPSGDQVDLSLSVDDGAATLSIVNRGVGVPPISGGTSTSSMSHASGTGAGLSVTRRVVERHGGKIRVQSEVDRAARFEIELPLASKRS